MNSNLRIAVISGGTSAEATVSRVSAKGVTEAKNVDMAWTVGTHLATGPLATLESIGHEAFEGMLSAHEEAGRINTNDAAIVTEYVRRVYSQT